MRIQQKIVPYPSLEDREQHRVGLRIVADKSQLNAILRELVQKDSSIEVTLDWVKRDGEHQDAQLRAVSESVSYTHRLPVNLPQGRVRYLKVEHLHWIEAANQYVRLHLSKKSYLLRTSMRQLAERLDPTRFVRIHRSSIVNLDFVVELQTEAPGHYLATLSGGQQLQVSQTHWARLRAALCGLESDF